MPIYQDVAEVVARENSDLLRSMNSGQRKDYLKSVMKKLSKKSDDELIQFISSRPQEVSPELTQKIGGQEERLSVVEQESSTAPRNVGEQNIFTGEALPLSVQANRLDLQKSQKEAELQSLGVDTGKEPVISGIELGFGANEIDPIKAALSEKFGKPVSVFKRGEDILYVDPNNREVVRFNPDLLSSVGGSIPVIGDIAGTVGGGVIAGLATKNPAGVVAGEAAGAGTGVTAGEAVRLFAGKWMGANNLTSEEIFNRSLKEGGKAAALTLGVGGTIAGAKGFNNFRKGLVFKQAEAIRSQEGADAAEVFIDEVNRIIKGKAAVKPTLGQRVTDPITEAAEAEVRGLKNQVRKFTALDEENKKAINIALDTITPQKGTLDPKLVSDVFKGKFNQFAEKSRSVIARTGEELKSQLSNLGKVAASDVGVPTRKILKEKMAATKKATDAVWDRFKSDAGFNRSTEKFNIPVPEAGKTKSLKAKFARQKAVAITKVGATPSEQLFVKKPSKIADLEDFNREIGLLKRKLRSIDKNPQFSDPDVSSLQRVIKAMEGDRRIALVKAGKGDLIAKIEAAEAATKKYHDTFNRSFVGDLIKKNDNGVFKIREQDFVEKMLKADTAEIDNFIDVIGKDPTLVQTWKEGIADLYKTASFKGFSFNKDKSERFISKFKPQLRKFFSEKEIAAMQKPGALADIVEAQSKKIRKTLQDAERKWGMGKLKSLDPDKLVDFVTNNSGSWVTPFKNNGVQTALNKIKYVKSATKKDYPQAWRAFQTSYGQSIKSRLKNPETGFIDGKRLAKFISTDSKEIAEIMGEQYLKDLKSISKVNLMVSKKGKKLGESEVTKGFVQAARAVVFHPLSPQGRGFTAARFFVSKKGHDVMAKGLLDPASISRVAELAKHNPNSRRAAELAVSLGFLDTTEE